MFTRQQGTERLKTQCMEGTDVNSNSSGNRIPRKLIRTLLWDRSYPLKLRPVIRRLHESASSLKPVLYRAEDIEAILEKHPAYAETYHNLPRRIMKADMSRLLILYEYGGWYFDLDIRATKNSLDDLIRNYEHENVVAFVESVHRDDSPKRDPGFEGHPSIRKEGYERGFEAMEEPKVWIGNCVLGASPGQGMIRNMLDEIVKRSVIDTHAYGDRGYNVLYLTGPNCITTAFFNNQSRYDDIAVVQREESDRYFRHKMSGTWRRQVTSAWK